MEPVQTSQPEQTSKNFQLYNNLIGSKKVSADDIGNFDQFNTVLQDSAKASKTYDNFITDGRLTAEDIGNKDQFLSSLDPVQKKEPEAEKSPPFMATDKEEGDPLGWLAYHLSPAKIAKSFLHTSEHAGTAIATAVVNDTNGFANPHIDDDVVIYDRETNKPIDTTKEDANRAKELTKGIADWDKTIPQDDESLATSIGSGAVYGGLAVLSMFQPELSPFVTGAFIAMGQGEGLQHADKIAEKEQKPMSDFKRQAYGFGYGVAYGVPWLTAFTRAVGGVVGKTKIGQKIASKLVDKIIEGNPEIITGAEKVMGSYLDRPPELKRVIQQKGIRTLKDFASGWVGLTSMGLTKEATNQLEGEKVGLQDYANVIKGSVSTAIGFEIMLGGFKGSLGNRGVRDRREEAGEVKLGMVGDEFADVYQRGVKVVTKENGDKEIIPKFEALLRGGKTVPVTQADFDNAIGIPLDVFNKTMKEGKISDNFDVDVFRSKIDKSLGGLVNENGNISYGEDKNGQKYIPVGTNPDGTMIVYDMDGVKGTSDQNSLTMSETTPAQIGDWMEDVYVEKRDNPPPEPVVPVDPRTQVQEQAEQFHTDNADKQTGNLKVVAERNPVDENNPKKWYVTGEINDPSGKHIYVVEDGQGGHLSLTSNDITEVSEMTKDEYVTGAVDQYDQQQSAQVQAQEQLKRNQVTLDGVTYTLVQDEKGNFVGTDEQGNTKEIPEDIIQRVTGGKSQDENFVSRTYGKSEVNGVVDANGIVSLIDPVNVAQYEKLRMAVEQNTGGKFTLRKELLPSDEGSVEDKFSATIEPTTPEEKSEVSFGEESPPQTAPAEPLTYTYNGNVIDAVQARKRVKKAILDGDKSILANLVTTDPEIQAVLEKVFPKPVTKVTYGGKTISAKDAIDVIDVCDNIKELQKVKIENIDIDPELKDAYNRKLEEFTPTRPKITPAKPVEEPVPATEEGEPTFIDEATALTEAPVEEPKEIVDEKPVEQQTGTPQDLGGKEGEVPPKEEVLPASEESQEDVQLIKKKTGQKKKPEPAQDEALKEGDRVITNFLGTPITGTYVKPASGKGNLWVKADADGKNYPVKEKNTRREGEASSPISYQATIKSPIKVGDVVNTTSAGENYIGEVIKEADAEGNLKILTDRDAVISAKTDNTTLVGEPRLKTLPIKESDRVRFTENGKEKFGTVTALIGNKAKVKSNTGTAFVNVSDVELIGKVAPLQKFLAIQHERRMESKLRQTVLFTQNIVKSIYRGIKPVVKAIRNVKRGQGEGATFNADGTQHEGRSVVVSFESTEMNHKTLDPVPVTNFIAEREHFFIAPNIRFGLFKSENSDLTSVDIGMSLPESSLPLAIKAGKFLRQNSLWNGFVGEYGKAVELGFDGNTPRHLTQKMLIELNESLLRGELPIWVTEIRPETSANFSNMTEDGKGNFVFYHFSGEKRGQIDPSKSGANTVTSPEERRAISKAGGVSFFYTDPVDVEHNIKSDVGHEVRIPKERVYDTDSDISGFAPEALKRYKEAYPDQAYSASDKAFWISKVAGENGFEMTVSAWNGTTRAQALIPHTPLDHQIKAGNVIETPFQNKFKGNRENFVPVEWLDKYTLLHNFLDLHDGKLGDLGDRGRMSLDDITKVIDSSEAPKELKDEYHEILKYKPEDKFSSPLHDLANFMAERREAPVFIPEEIHSSIVDRISNTLRNVLGIGKAKMITLKGEAFGEALKQAQSVGGLKFQAVGAFTKNTIEESEAYQKHIEDGDLTKDFDLRTIGGKPTVIINPDNMFVGDLMAGDKKILNAEGGIKFVLATGDVWASADKRTADILVKKINEAREQDIKNGGDGTIHILVTKGSAEKTIFSRGGSIASVQILEHLVQLGSIKAKDLQKALTDVGSKPEYGIDFSDSKSLADVSLTVRDNFLDTSATSFRKRKAFLEEVIGHLGKNSKSVKENIEKIRTQIDSESVGRKIDFSVKGVSEALGTLLSDEMTQGVEGSHVYATIQVDRPVITKEGGHGSYPFHIQQEDGSRAILNEVAEKMHITDVVNDVENNVVPRTFINDAGKEMSGGTKLGSNSVGWAEGTIKRVIKKPELALMHNAEGKIYGFEQDGKVVLNGDLMNGNTPVHEAGHIWTKWAKTDRSDLYDAGMEKVADSEYHKAVSENPFYQEQVKDMTPEEADAYLKEEALSRAIGDQGESFINETKKASFKQWLSDLWDSIAKYAGIRGKSAEEISKMSLNEFSKHVASDILGADPTPERAREAEGDIIPDKGIRYDQKSEETSDLTDFLNRIGGFSDVPVSKPIKIAEVKKSTPLPDYLTQSKERTVGVSHQNLNYLAKRLGLPEVERGKVRNAVEQAERGRRFLAEGADPYKLEDWAGKTADKISISGAYLEKLVIDADAISDKKSDESKEALQKIEEYQKEIVKEFGTDWAQQAQALQGARNLDTDSFTAVHLAVKKSSGQTELTDAQIEEVQNLTDTTAKLNSKVKELERKLREKTDAHIGERPERRFTAQRAGEIADNLLRKGRLSRPDSFAMVTPASLVWDGAIETVAKTIKLSGKASDAIDSGIKHIKGTDWYEGLTHEKQKQAEKDFRDFTEQELNSKKYQQEVRDSKRIAGLEKQLADLKNDIVTETTPKAQREKTDQEQELLTQIKGEKARIKDELDFQSLKKSMGYHKGSDFTPEESKAIWDYAKKKYLNNGTSFKDMISDVGNDLGLTFFEVSKAIVTPKTQPITDEVWQTRYDMNRNRSATQRYIDNQSPVDAIKAFKTVSNFIREVKVFGHGGVFIGTHAGMTLMDLPRAHYTIKAFMNAYKNAYGSSAKYEMAMTELKGRTNYITARKAGLQNDPDRVNNDSEIIKPMFGKLSLSGMKGFNAIKTLRQDLFDSHYNELTPEQQKNSEVLRTIAKLINTATGATNIKLGGSIDKVFTEATFAGGMEFSRWEKLIGNPAKAVGIGFKAGKTLFNGKRITPEDKVFIKTWSKRCGWELGAYVALLAVNSGLQSYLNDDKNPVNLTDWKKSDWLKMKIGAHTLDFSSGMISTQNFIKRIALIAFENDELNSKGLPLNTRGIPEGNGSNALKATGRYLRGKLAPAYAEVADLVSRHDYAGNTLPMFDDKPERANNRKLTWKEYLLEKSPLPVGEGIKVFYDEASKQGLSEDQTSSVLKGLAGGLVSGLSGFRTYENDPEVDIISRVREITSPAQTYMNAIKDARRTGNTVLEDKLVNDPLFSTVRDINGRNNKISNLKKSITHYSDIGDKATAEDYQKKLNDMYQQIEDEFKDVKFPTKYR